MVISPIQDKEYNCGPTAVEYLLAMKGRFSDRETLEHDMGTTDKDGTSHDAIVKQLGYGALERISKAKNVRLFSIVNYQYDGDGHYGVCVAKTSEHIFIFNPAIGEVDKYSIDEFDSVFTSERYGDNWSCYVK